VHELKNRETVVEFPNPVTVNKTFSEVYQIRTPDSGEDSRIIQFPRAS
jgi:hypothetical protein